MRKEKRAGPVRYSGNGGKCHREINNRTDLKEQVGKHTKR